MERWKLTHADRYPYNPKEAVPKVGTRARSKEMRAAIAERFNAVYECGHGIAVYRLRADEAGLFFLPRPVCAECVGEMLLISLFGEKRGAW